MPAFLGAAGLQSGSGDEFAPVQSSGDEGIPELTDFSILGPLFGATAQLQTLCVLLGQAGG